MRDILAERLLAKVMRWTSQDVALQRSELQALATFKYDEYQQFFPGMRFIESLALWLDQFRTIEERECAYDFIRSEMIFISSKEINHLVSSTFPDVIRPFLIEQVASQMGQPEWLVGKTLFSTEFKVLLRKCLFLGLSDGAHTDVFRRSNPHISHEQVLQDYRIDDPGDGVLKKLNTDVSNLLKREQASDDERHRIIFLLDDFSGSGISYLRKNHEEESYSGKIKKVFESITYEGKPLNRIVNSEEIQVCLVLYVATEDAIKQLKALSKEWLENKKSNIRFNILPVQILSQPTWHSNDKSQGFLKILENYFDSSIMNEHWSMGKMDKPHLGFNEGALPLILNHNTPNNSLPLLWFEQGRKHRGLFPRVNRHQGRS